MLARHPKTGAPIRIIKSEGSIWRDSKTLAWLDATADELPRWTRYDIGVSSLEAWAALYKKVPISICVLLGDEEASANWLIEGNASTVKVVAVPKAVLQRVGFQQLVKLRIANMLCIEEAFDMYPFLESSWDGTEDDARIMCAMVLRYVKTGPCPSTEAAHAPIAATLGLSVLPTLPPPPKVVLITQYYVPPKPRRAAEIDLCLKRNIESKYIDKIVLLNEAMHVLPESPKVSQDNIGGRLRFDHVFKWIYENAEPNTIVVIANSDIYVDDSLRVIWSVDMADKFLSLLRWDDSEIPGEKPVLFGPRPDSQDTWIISSDSVKARTWDWKALNIPFGKGGCDNAINVEMLRQKFLIVNPCVSIITHHVHTSGYRTYDPRDIVEKPIYMHLNPTGIHDLKADLNMPAPFKTLAVKASVPVLNGPSVPQKETFFKMLERSKVIKDGIVAQERSIPLYKMKNVIQGADGLLSTYGSILVGPSKTAADAWSAKELNIVSSCVDVDVAMVAYLPDSCAADPYKYILNYLGKILVLQGLSGKVGEFLAVKSEKSKDILNLFNWKTPSVPVLARDQNFQAWCREAYVWYPEDNALPTAQEVDALREAFQFGWDSTPTGPILCLVDDGWVSEKLVADLETELGTDDMRFVAVRPTDSMIELAEKFNGAAGMVTFSDNPLAALSWLLPKGAKVWEIQSEMKPTPELVHLAGVAGLKHIMHIVARSVPQNAIEKGLILKALCKIIGGLIIAAPVPAVAALPVVLMPRFNLEGFFAHAGDSFREVVKMWGERKYVTIRESDSPHIWLGGEGETLLYDRPTLQWLEAAPVTWKKALFGNPAPKGGSPWSFWPRRPRIVEELVARGAPSKTFEERTLGTVFYGRSENAVQKANRTVHDWSTACDDYVHLEGSAPYPYSHREYLERLSKARFGLCLAGFGKKCHREIECMAMGCVPVVAPEVDMDNYADPPVEGIHYIRVTSPADMVALKDFDQASWLAMSDAGKAWWVKNCSVKGLWELTKSL